MQPVPQQVQTINKRLDSWKEIAAYLGASVRTVQRWEEQNGLPVRRVLRDKRSAVFAMTADLDGWLSSRSVLPETKVVKSSWFPWVVATVSSLALGLTAVWWWQRPFEVQAEMVMSISGREIQGSYSPDGKSLVFVYGIKDRSGIGIQRVGAGGFEKVTDGTETDASPVWSPDGKRIAFLRRIDGKRDRVMVFEPGTGNNPREVGYSAGRGWFDFIVNGYPGVQWSADGSQLLVSGEGKEGWRIESVNIADGNRKIVFQGSLGERVGGFALRPDGKDLVVALQSPNLEYRLHHVMGTRRAVAVGEGELRSPVWMDNKRLAFLRNDRKSRLPGAEVWVELNGGKTQQVKVEGPGPEMSIGAGPNGVLIWGNLPLDTALYLRDLESGVETGPICDSSTLERMARLSPDGKTWVFTSQRDGKLNLWACEAEGDRVWQVTKYANGGVWSPEWSPDGEQIAFTQNEGKQQGIFLTSRNGGTPRLVSDAAEAYSNDPSWSRDGKTLYFVSGMKTNSKVMALDLQSGKARVVYAKPVSRWIERSDGKFWVLGKNALQLLDLATDKIEVKESGVEGIGGLDRSGLGVYFTKRESAGLAGALSWWVREGERSRKLLPALPGVMGFGAAMDGKAVLVRMSSFEGDLYQGKVR